MPSVISSGIDPAVLTVRRLLALMQVLSFAFAIWVLGSAYMLLDASGWISSVDHPGWISVALAVCVVLAIRAYHLWKWDIPGARVRSILIAAGHLGFAVGCLLYADMRQGGQGSGLLLLLPAAWCLGLYVPGSTAIVIALLKKGAKKPLDAN